MSHPFGLSYRQSSQRLLLGYEVLPDCEFQQGQDPQAEQQQGQLSSNQRGAFAMPTYAIILSIVASILDIVGVILLFIKTFDADS